MSRQRALFLILKQVACKFKIAPNYFSNLYDTVANNELKRKWLIKSGSESFFNFNGAKLPDISASKEKMDSLRAMLKDVFFIPCFYNENYDKSLVECLDEYMPESPYGYTDGEFDVTVKNGDVVIDAGAWIGDFSAYAATKNATVYAFEPIEETFEILKKTAILNDNKIIPIKKGLGDKEEIVTFSVSDSSLWTSMALERDRQGERAQITTLDNFVNEHKLEKVSFIKADIEGAERDMLKGATNVLKKNAPKLVICTYHLPDDKEVLERIILEANPNYKIVHLKHKLFAMVV